MTLKEKKYCYYFWRIRRGVFFFLFDEEEEFSQFSLSAMVDYIFPIVNYLISLFSLQIWKDLEHCQLLTDLWQILCVIMSHLQQEQRNFNCSEILLNNKKKSSYERVLGLRTDVSRALGIAIGPFFTRSLGSTLVKKHGKCP